MVGCLVDASNNTIRTVHDWPWTRVQEEEEQTLTVRSTSSCYNSARGVWNSLLEVKSTRCIVICLLIMSMRNICHDVEKS